MRSVWDKWDLRGSVLVSLLCQATLSFLGNRRKRSVSKVTYSLVWATYLISDWVANFALGIISSNIGDSKGHCGDHRDDPILLAFWASLLLVHFGCPATITAEALEDNALWPRNLALWLLQSVRVLYIILMAWKNTCLSYLSLAVFVVGFIKCGEKTCALYFASIDNSLDMLIPPLEPKREESSKLSQKGLGKSGKYEIFVEELGEFESSNILEMNPQVLLRNFILFYVSLFVDLVLSFDYLRKHQTNFRRLKPSQAFELVEVQLGYAYDVFYTKASVMHSPWYHIVEIITSNLSLGAIICFGAIVKQEHSISKTDHVITWALLVGTVVLDYYALCDIALSEWFGGRAIRLLRGALQNFPGLDLHKYGNKVRDMLTIFKRRRWSNAITEGNLLTLCLGHNNLSGKFNKLHKLLETRLCSVDGQLKDYIFHHLVNKSKLPLHGLRSCKYGANDAIDSHGIKSIEWTKKLEFHQSILTWHIVTDMCYYGIGDVQDQGPMADSKVRICKNLSDYMLYILVKQRQMLPVGTGLISFRDTCVETMEFFQQSKIERPSHNIREACQKLLLVDPDAVKRSQSNSVLLDACRLARTLTNELERKQRWELLTTVWVEILTFAATQCAANQHAHQLKKGGEFLTHVWLLSAHIGVMEQFQVTSPPVYTSEEQLMDQNSELVNGKTSDVQEVENRIGQREIEEELVP